MTIVGHETQEILFSEIDSLQFLVHQASELTDQYKIKTSLEHSMKLAAQAQEVNNKEYQAIAYYLIANNYKILADYQFSRKYYSRSLRIAKSVKDSLLILKNYSGLGDVHFKGFKSIEISLSYYDKAVELGKQINASSELRESMLNLAWAYLDMGEPDKALPYLDEAENLIIAVKDFKAYCVIKYLRGRYHLAKKERDKAEFSFTEAIQGAEQHGMFPNIANSYKSRAALYEQIGDTAKAFQDIKAYQKYRDMVFDKEKIKQIEIAKISFDVQGYERQLKIAQQEKEYQLGIARNNKIINIISIIGLFLLSGVVFVIFKGYLNNKKFNKVLVNKNVQLEEARVNAENLAQVKSQFVSTISHELRTPLYGVVGIASMLLDEKQMSKKHKELLNSLKFSGDYLLDIINNVLKISKMESRTLSLTKTPINLLEFSRNVSNSLIFQVKQNSNQLILEIPEELPELVLVDALRLSEILLNLVGNATKFTKNGKIWLRIIELKRTTKHVDVRYEIEDNGIGIAEEKKGFVFEEFSQVSENIEEIHGTGLGLSIVKHILEMMGSEICLESELGKGTKFYFDLKLAIVGDEYREVSTSNEDKMESENKKILVAEDNKINQIVTKDLLGRIGFDCTMVGNGKSVVSEMENNTYDLILMDINMPDINGLEATKLIRAFNQDIPIIALTASELHEVKGKCMDAGMNDVLNKPLDSNDLKEAISKNLLS